MKNKTNVTKVRTFHVPLDRRRFFKSMALVSAGLSLPGHLAEPITITPQVTQGPYYPLAKNIPLDKDNELAHLADELTAATGTVTYVLGRFLDGKDNSIRGALVELSHANNGGEYT